MHHEGSAHEGFHIFTGSIPCRRSGLCGFTVRVIPFHPDLANIYDTGLICWEQAETDVRQTAKTAPAEAI